MELQISDRKTRVVFCDASLTDCFMCIDVKHCEIGKKRQSCLHIELHEIRGRDSHIICAHCAKCGARFTTEEWHNLMASIIQ
jgi:hypothetical protein